MKRFLVYYLVPVLLCLVSCMREQTDGYSGMNQAEEKNVFGETTVLGERLDNPYSLANMQEALDELTKTKSTFSSRNQEKLRANWIYVRILPKDSTDLRIIDGLNLDLFDYPLDYEIKVYGSSYHDPSIPEGEPTWLYTRIRPDMAVPEKLTWEILDECFIPDDDVHTKSSDSFFYEELEKLALVRAGIQLDDTPQTKAARSENYPYGTVKVDASGSGGMLPVKGAKITCNVLLKIASTYTDKNGSYSIQTPFYSKPVYHLEFDNVKNFTIWDGINFLSPADINYGKQSIRYFHIGIPKGSKEYDWATYNNAGYDYYETCAEYGVPTPPSNLKIMTFYDGDSMYQWGSAPMLRRLGGVRIDSNSKLVDIISNIFFIPVSTVLMTVFKIATPDIFITSSNQFSYKDKYWLAWHELSHASHFRVAGIDFWQKAASAILTRGFNYGAKTDDHSGLIDIMEAWAFAFTGDTMYKFGEASSILSKRGRFTSGEEFHYHLMAYLLDRNVLTPSQLINLLKSDVNSYETFKKRLLLAYPAKKTQIENILKYCPE